MTTRREPTFLVAGGQRCGSTWLYHLLYSHPQIYMAKPVRPEPKFFLEDQRPGRDEEWYLNRWFSDVGEEIAIGEKSTSYMETPGVAKRMKQSFPDLKILFVLRHPIDRAFSNYRFSRMHGYEPESFDFAIKNEASRLRETRFPELSAHPHAYVRRGRYTDFLDEFYENFPPGQIRIVLYEDLQSDPQGTCSSFFRFLGVDPEFAPPRVAQPKGSDDWGDLSISKQTLSYLHDQFAGSNRRLAAMLSRDLSHWDAPTSLVKRLLSD